MRRLGCLLLLVIIVAAAYLTRARWMPAIGRRPAVASAPAGPVWQPLTLAGAARARAAIERLGSSRGPVYVNIAPGDLASYIYQQLARQLPPSADSLASTVIGDAIYLRASVRTDDPALRRALGPLGGFLSGREPMQFGGTFDILRPGLAEFRVTAVKVGEFPIPSATIPRLLAAIEHGSRPAGVSPNGLPLVVPKYVGDVRIGNAKVTLYKNVP